MIAKKKVKKNDAFDLVYLTKILVEQGRQVSEECASKFATGYYHMVFVRIHTRPENFDKMIKAGIHKKFLLPWVENSEEQQEYYTAFWHNESDLITVSISELMGDRSEGR